MWGYLCYIVYRPGIQYMYTYETQALTGIRPFSDQYSGLSVKCNVKIQVLTDGSHVLKMVNIRLYTLNSIRNSSFHVNDQELLTDEELPRMTGDLVETMVEHLVKPVVFRYAFVHKYKLPHSPSLHLNQLSSYHKLW